jgi:AcrR family transcriptional regulator
MTRVGDIPLRERKYARTKLTIMEAAIGRLESRSFEDLSVKELCETAQVSEATFFNYFPRKSDLLTYTDQIWSLEIIWHGLEAARRHAGLAVINEVFSRTAQQVQKRPGLMGELIANQSRGGDKSRRHTITPAERLLAFPDLSGIEDTPAEGLESILVPNLRKAVEKGELPANTLLPTVLVSLISIFYGVPLALRQTNPAGVAPMYRQQLAILWAGLKTLTRESTDEPGPAHPGTTER